MVKIRVRVERISPLVTGRRWRLLFIKHFHWNRNRSLSSLRKQPFLLATRPARSETVSPLSQGLDDRAPPPPPPPYLNVWIRHCIVLVKQWWEHSPPTNLAWVEISKPTPYTGWVCCQFLSLLGEVFLRILLFSSLLKTNIFKLQFNLECTV